MARTHAILDSNIIIELLLKLPAAITWSGTVEHIRFGVTSITIMEVLRGARNKQELNRIGRELSRFDHIHFLRQDSIWAVRQFRAFWLSHQIGINDCLIAAIAARTELPVYTHNLKDFEPLPDIKVVKPY